MLATIQLFTNHINKEFFGQVFTPEHETIQEVLVLALQL